MGHTACAEPQCLYKGALYLFTLLRNVSPLICHLQGVHTKLKTIYSKVDYVNGNHNLGELCSLLLLLLLLRTAVEFSLGGISSYTSTDKINKNKYTGSASESGDF